MRAIVTTLCILSLAACGGKDKTNQATADSLSRDLQMAQHDSGMAMNDTAAAAPAPAAAPTAPPAAAPKPVAPKPAPKPVPKPAPSRMTHVKMRSFIPPGATVDIEAELAPSGAESAMIRLAARMDGKTAATARLEVIANAASVGAHQ